MPVELQLYKEALSADELRFLREKEAKERSQYFQVYRLLMPLGLLVSFLGSWFREDAKTPSVFSMANFCWTAGIIGFIITFSTVFTYCLFHRRLRCDIRSGTKTVELIQVSRKLALQKSYHCFIASKIKLSIEVSYNDYLRLGPGDEICIEYTTHSKLYLGYF